MRKVFVVLCAVFLLGICVVPAFAYGVDPDPDEPIQYGYSALQFSEITDGVGSYTWPYNNSVYGTYHEPFEFSSFFRGDISFDSLPGSVYGDFYLPLAGGSAGDGKIYTITLSQFQAQLVKMLELDSFILRPLSGVRVTSVDISFFIVEPTLGASLTDFDRQTWQLASYAASDSFYPSADGEMSIGTWIRSMLREHPQSRSYNVAMMQDLKVTINFTRTSVDTPGFSLAYYALDANPISFITEWSKGRQMFRDVEMINPDYNFLGWLFDCVDGFLDVQIAPTITFRTIFYAALVIGILCAFLAIMG